ncbi:MAG: helix-turn-helix domain-containing protein [Actinomycetota bacterium]
MGFYTKQKEFICPVETTLELLSGRWKVKILWKLQKQEPIRFGELKELLQGITDKVLTTQLRELEHDGLIGRKTFAEFPPRVEYSLTKFGESLKLVFDTIAVWGTEHQKNILTAIEK